jgi:hypothetical protein
MGEQEPLFRDHVRLDQLCKPRCPVRCDLKGLALDGSAILDRVVVRLMHRGADPEPKQKRLHVPCNLGGNRLEKDHTLANVAVTIPKRCEEALDLLVCKFKHVLRNPLLCASRTFAVRTAPPRVATFPSESLVSQPNLE